MYENKSKARFIQKYTYRVSQLKYLIQLKVICCISLQNVLVLRKCLYFNVCILMIELISVTQ